jgi:hypothetical protein
MPQIALRFQMTRSGVAYINNKYQIRHYDGRRTSWKELYAG